MKNKVLITIVTLFAGTILFSMITSFKGFQDKKPWVVPDKYVKMANPATIASVKVGKELWVKHCQSCHGKAGKGDGPKAAQLKTEPGNFSLPEYQKQTDGALFFKIAEGRNDMPSFKKKIPDADDIWNVIIFMRTLKS